MNYISGLWLAAAIAPAWACGSGTASGAPPAARPVAYANTAAPTSSGPLSLAADISARMLSVRLGDAVSATYAVSVGADGHDTPTGTFRIRKLVWNPRWVPPKVPWARGKTAKAPGDPDNPMQTVKIFFKEPDYYIHGTPATESLGEAASKGCLRMDPEEVAQLAKLVMEHGGQPRPESWFQRIRRFVTREHVVLLDNPVTLTIRP